MSSQRKKSPVWFTIGVSRYINTIVYFYHSTVAVLKEIGKGATTLHPSEEAFIWTWRANSLPRSLAPLYCLSHRLEITSF